MGEVYDCMIGEQSTLTCKMPDFTYPSLSLVSTGFPILLKQPIIPSVFVILSVTRPLSTQDLFWEKI